MSYVSDFLISPVLRQARRFSRSQTHGEQLEQRTSPDRNNDEIASGDIAQGVEVSNGNNITGTISDASMSGEPLTSSPVEEHGALEDELEHLEGIRASAQSEPGLPTSLQGLPLRVDSLRLNRDYMDYEMSDNPSFGILRSGSSTYNSQNAVSARMSPAEGPSRRSTLEGTHSSLVARRRNSSLPADDGMGVLRQQIVSIQAMDAPQEQKAHLMHQLLCQGYTQSKELLKVGNESHVQPPTNMISQQHPITSASLSSFIWQMNGSTDNAVPIQQHVFHLSPEDLKQTFAPSETPDFDEDSVVRVTSNQNPILGCIHYKRNVKLQCSTCDRWYTCRLCHDEAEDHVLVRKATKNMLCMLCSYAQAAGEHCVGCGERTAWYYCDVCKLWDNDPNKSIYHCNDCGICRKGRGLGKDFFHCKTCGVCMSMSNEHSHKCIERVSDCDCPICGEYMFTSPRPVVFMLCGHSIHQTCYYEHMKSSYKCPICSKSTVNMETQFRNLDRAIDNQPMPPQFQDTKAMVSCNDCYAKSAVKYHWLGLKCAICDSYNTVQLSILSDPAVEVPVPETRESDHTTLPAAAIGVPSVTAIPSINSRPRRHSSHLHIPRPSPEDSDLFSSYHVPSRLGRSVSPVRVPGLFADVSAVSAETDESEDDSLDFWGRDELRSITSAELVDDELGMDDEDDSDDSASIQDDECDDDDGDDEDQFELLGHP
ncbi:hypothetical protein B0O99DRAFT_610102 [Bisporella sp. PMI_857]|nr:hypothetical protein B0O99DRAFT_610102 [Bisporella sp. PMI_857]